MRILAPTPSPAAFAFRVLRDAFLEADRAYWLARADRFELARPRPGDFTGQATPADLAALDQRLTDTAAACRARAGLVDASEQTFVDTLHSIAGAA